MSSVHDELVRKIEELKKVDKDKQAALLKEGWVLGVKDAIREVERRSQYFRNMGPNARPAPGVIKLLDEIALLLKAMEQRGEYSSHSVLMMTDHSDGEPRQVVDPQLVSDLEKIKEQVERRCPSKWHFQPHPDLKRCPKCGAEERDRYVNAPIYQVPGHPLAGPLLRRCQEKDEAGAQCLLMKGHQDIHRFRDDTAAVWEDTDELES